MPQEMEDYRLTQSIAKAEGRPKRGPMPTNFYKPDGTYRSSGDSPTTESGDRGRITVGADTARRHESLPRRPERGYEQHLYINRLGVSEFAGEELYIHTEIQNASSTNPVPITSYEGEKIDVDESRSDRYDFTYAHGLPGGRTLLGRPRRSWGPWTNQTWNKGRVDCITR